MFRQAMRAARGGDEKQGGGGGGMGFSQPAQDQYDDRIECKWCGRKFNEQAGLRHMPHCEQKYKESQIKGKGKPMQVGRTTGSNFRKR